MVEPMRPPSLIPRLLRHRDAGGNVGVARHPAVGPRSSARVGQNGGVHQLRTRMAGPVLMMQMHVDLEPDQTLEAAHGVVVEAESRILKAFPGADILIHPDPRGRTRPHGGVTGDAGVSTGVPVTE